MDVYMSEEFKIKRRIEREMRRKGKSSNAESDDQHAEAKKWTAGTAGYKQEGGVDAKRNEDILFSFFSA
jgi:hypothetical protein